MKSNFAYQALCYSMLALLSVSSYASTSKEAELISLGKKVFFDESLSNPVGQSCASCHSPDQGFANKGKIVTEGADKSLYGNRNAPSIAYSNFTPEWHYNSEDGTWIGGLFMDGRAISMHEQAKGPFLNPAEMGNTSAKMVVEKVLASDYRAELIALLGKTRTSEHDKAFDVIAAALTAFEQSSEFAPRFTSKYDAYLRGETELSELEALGLEVFEAEEKGNCAACHPSHIDEDGGFPLFTDFSYDNLGVAKQPASLFYTMPKHINSLGANYVDLGLFDNPRIEDKDAEKGKFKVPTLRNVALTAPYMHNGVFANLEDSVSFYNKRDVESKWGPAEVTDNVNTDELGDLKLSDEEERALVAFMKTLTDNWQNSSSEEAVAE